MLTTKYSGYYHKFGYCFLMSLQFDALHHRINGSWRKAPAADDQSASNTIANSLKNAHQFNKIGLSMLNNSLSHLNHRLPGVR